MDKGLEQCDKCDYFISVEEAYQQGKADAIEEIKHQMISFHTDAIFQYGADAVESKCSAFDNLKNWIKEQNNA